VHDIKDLPPDQADEYRTHLQHFYAAERRIYASQTAADKEYWCAKAKEIWTRLENLMVTHRRLRTTRRDMRLLLAAMGEP
jgi:hypothetical protein